MAPFFMVEPGKDHSHYSEELTRALVRFRDAFGSYMARSSFKKMDGNTIQCETVQAAWDDFIRLRRKETGYAYYTPPKEKK